MESLFEEKVINNLESCSIEIIKNAFDKFFMMKLISFHQVSKKEIRLEVNCSVEKL